MRIILISLALFAISTIAHAQDIVFHHEITVSIDPYSGQLEVRDTISFPDAADVSDLVFSLHEGLSPKSLTDGVTLEASDEVASSADKGMDQEDFSAEIRSSHYRISVAAGVKPESLTLEYAGIINHPVKQANQEYARGFSQSPGLIDPQGVYLSGSTNWIPSLGEEYVTYKLTVHSPAGWRSVSQGERTAFEEQTESQGAEHIDTWEVVTPTEEIFVIAAEFIEYEYAVGNVMAMAFLREKDDGLANKYLETTAQYMEMYRGLIGTYPYSKFALVENFWETGYGMPSFTLLGPQIIRFPFILHSSYPHELLHNWWGNGVFVDFETGNWCEGLTAYMADHLIAEQRGTGAAYRRSTLQGYTDYVTAENEFPLKDFLSRTNASSSSIGYGKTAMMFDMLRDDVGDENFKRAFQKFYRENKFKRAGFDDIRLAFEDVSGKQLGPFFEQWIDQAGAPELTIKNVQVTDDKVELELAQLQSSDAYRLSVPVVIYTADEAIRKVVEMNSKQQSYSLAVSGKPLRVEVDPQFNLMRRLDYREIPPSLSKMFGAEKTLMILPSKVSDAELAKYESLSSIWKGDRGGEFEVKLDSEVSELPADRSIWVLGEGNLWLSAIESGLKPYDAEISIPTVRLGSVTGDISETSMVIALRNPGNPDLALTWLTAHDAEAVAGLARKLPHYGKYSYLGFTGTEPTNSAKGQWPAVGSPLAADLAKYSESLPQLEKRPALAMLAPVFNAARMQEDVNTLAADEMQGRGLGSAGLEASAEYIAEQFRAAGLEPAGDNDSYFQTFSVAGEDGKPVTVRNVLGVIPGSKAEWSQESVVLSAHYDHLGLGWPDAKSGNKGKIHNGADDNASGVAVMLELARTLGKSMEPSRAVVFAAFTAEEAGLLGARHYVKNMQRYPAEKVMGNLNVDTVGRLGDNKLLVIGSGSAREWKFIFMGASFVTGVQTEMPTQDIASSDQVAFIEAGIPAVQFFAGASPDYHKPSDTADNLDANGLVKVASIVREGVEYLAERPEPMEFKGSTTKSSGSKPAAGERRVSTGLMPDFAFSGKGVSIGALGEDSPAAQAGLAEGDVITAINGTGVADLRAYSNLLKTFSPGDVIDVTYSRDGTEQTTKLTLKGR